MKIKKIIVLCIISIFSIILVSNAEETQSSVENSFEVNMEYIYNEKDNTVTAIMKSNNILKDTKPTWKLSKDKLSYSKVYNTNSKYYTQVQDILGNIAEVEVEITRNR